MAIEKYFSLYEDARIVFDPAPSYFGDWVFTIDNLIKNSKKENGVNLFKEFHKKTYQEPLKKIFNTDRILDLNVGLLSTVNANNIGRCLKYSKVDFIIELINFLDCHIDRYGKTEEERIAYFNQLLNNVEVNNDALNEAFSESLKEKARKLKDVMDNEINSMYFEAAMLDYAPYKNSIDFSTYISRMYQVTVDFQNGILQLGDFFDQPIDYNELYNCFDPDIFYLLFAKIIYEFNLIREKESNTLDNSYGYMYHYINAIEKVIQDDKKYDPKILFTLPNGKKIRYSRWQFQMDFKELMDRHPEAGFYKLPLLDDENVDKYRDVALMEKIAKLHTEDTKVNWDFLPKGEGIKKGTITKNDSQSTSRDKEALVEEVNMRISIMENSGSLSRPIKGLNTFSGYYAFVYPNGKVILEKFWENEENLTPAVGCATYVMDIDNFVEMSKISRINLVEYIKTLPEIGVKRIFHMSVNNWQRNLYNEINGTYRIEDAIEFINGLNNGVKKND